MAKHEIDDTVFIVDDFPKKGGGAAGRGPTLVAEMLEASQDPGKVYCVKSYAVAGSAAGMAKALRERYPNADIRSRKREDTNLYGVFVKFPTGF